ncbi:MAG: ATPase [Elusimicrobia bacterium CG08_land_8_20_14_0_20_44_26]|nr:MAG: ATPase [Elusimicrobia bacterium CG08_land_8_20_14_0_20_44_26]
MDINVINSEVVAKNAKVKSILRELHEVIVGQDALLERLLIGIFSQNHILVEGVPGLAKTLAVRTLAGCLDMKFHRIQFTPDMLPADIIGTQIYRPSKEDFSVRKGPVFTNFVLGDEINRAPAKVQSALLEAMQERQVTIGETTHPLPAPFFVMATQNPIEQEGTYPLPEAQIDRFMMKVVITYPTQAEEKEILERVACKKLPEVKKTIDIDEIFAIQDLISQIYIDDKIKNYCVSLSEATRKPQDYGLNKIKNFIAWGVSPRATIHLVQAARVKAFIQARGFVIPEDVKDIAGDVFRHRIILSYEGEAENYTPDSIISEILSAVEVP